METSTAIPEMSAAIQELGTSMNNNIGELVTAVIPVIGITVGAAILIFGIMWVIKTIKKVFTRTSN